MTGRFPVKLRWFTWCSFASGLSWCWLITSRGSFLIPNPSGSCNRANANHKKGLEMVPDDPPRHVSWLEMSAHVESPFTKSQQGAHSASLPPPLSLYSDSQTRFQAKVHHSSNSYLLLPNTKKCHTDHRLTFVKLRCDWNDWWLCVTWLLKDSRKTQASSHT